MASHDAHQLKVFFLPFLTPGHMIPMVDLARIFAKHGVDATVITTKANAQNFQKAINRDSASGHSIKIHIIPFPFAQVGLPEGIENFNTCTAPGMSGKLYYGMSLLEKPIDDFLESMHPDCIVSDMFFPWTVDAAERLGIPRLIFHVSNFFALCAAYSIRTHEPHKAVESDTEKFLLPGLPGNIEMTRSQLPDWVKNHGRYTDIINVVREAERKSYGALVNSFAGIEGAYEENYKSVMGIKAWSVGPVSLWVSDKVDRGEKASVEEHECMSWLNEKESKSVLYVSFGSMMSFSGNQLMEIAHGLESSGHPFIWVIRTNEENETCMLPQGFEERMKESKKGFIIKGWAPQLMILDHPSTGGFLTHCGWNSVLESINSGLPMVTWPLYAEQFYNERFVIDVLKIGIPVGVQSWHELGQQEKELVDREKTAKAVKLLMSPGEEAAEIRKRVSEFGKEAMKALEDGGSSKKNLLALIDDLKSKSKQSKVF